MKFLALFVVCLPLTIALRAQSPAQIKADADGWMKAGRYAEAHEQYERYQNLKPGNLDVLKNLAISAFQSNQLAQAKEILVAIAENPASDPISLYYLAQAYHYELNFKEAIRIYKLFLAATKLDYPYHRAAVANIKRCASGLKMAGAPESALVENLGDRVNTPYDEFSPVQSPNFEDRLYFSSGRENSEGGRRDETGMRDDRKGKYTADIFFTDAESGEWTSPVPINNGLVNTPRNEVILDFDESGKSMYFFRSPTFFSGEILKNVYKADEEIRSLPAPLQSPVRAEEGDNALFFFRDTILLFASRRAGGYGGLDLYITIFTDGRWSDPKNLGPTINSAYDETTPFLAKDGRTLYFSSNNPQSMGGLDVFKATFSDIDLKWSDPVNLGAPVNSAGDDAFFRLTPDGMKAYFSSDRKDHSFGGRDLFVALFKTYQREQGRPSTPLVFSEVEAYREFVKNNPNATTATADKKYPINEADYLNVDLQPLFYDEDADLTKTANLRQLQTLVGLMKRFPQTKLLLAGNCGQGERPQYDLYFTIKRVEKIAKYLIDKGVPKDNIILKSVGSGYPIARVEVNGQPNPSGEKMNKRIDLYLQNLESLPVNLHYNEPTVSEITADRVGDQLKKHFKGLTYKIQIASIKSIYEGETVSKYSGGMVEAGADGVYIYSVGLFNDFKSADKIKQDIVQEGIKDAFVVPYVNGVRVLGDEKRYSSRYSDLLNFLTAKNKKG